jgi:hypothetical protein
MTRLASKDRVSEALELSRRTIERARAVPEAYDEVLELIQIRASLLVSQGDIDQIRKDFEEFTGWVNASSLADRFVLVAQVEFWRAYYLARVGAQDEARRGYASLADRLRGAPDVRLRSTYARTVIQLAATASAAGESTSALETLKVLIADLGRETEPEIVREMVHAMSHEAIELQRTGATPEARAVLETIVDQFSNHPYTDVAGMAHDAAERIKELSNEPSPASPDLASDGSSTQMPDQPRNRRNTRPRKSKVDAAADQVDRSPRDPGTDQPRDGEQPED